MDILGRFPPASGQWKFLLVAIDYFTKWVEAKPLAQITEAKVENFIQNSIIIQFGISQTIITDNGRQFNNPKFWDFHQQYHTPISLLPSVTLSPMEKLRSPIGRSCTG